MTKYLIKIPIHKLYVANAALIFGIIWQSLFNNILINLLATILFIFIVAIIYLFNKISAKNFFNVVFIFLSFFAGSFQYNNYINNYKKIVNNISNQKISIRARVSALYKSQNKAFKNSITLEITEIKLDCKNLNCNMSLKISCLWEHDLKVGDEIILDNIFITKNNNPDFEKYLIKENILSFLFITKLEYKKVDSSGFWIQKKLAQLKQRIFLGLSKKFHKNTYNIFGSLFLGYKDSSNAITQKTGQSFSYWGIIHYLARSGLHIALIILIWDYILKFFPIYYLIKQLIMLFFIILYNLLTWPSISFFRALLIFLIYKACNIKQLATKPLYVLILTCFITLISNPMQLFFLDFQLSFGLTFLLFWFSEIKQQIKNY